MKIADFNKLKKLMMMTMSGAEAEVAFAIKSANRILTDNKIDWDRVLNRTVTVVNEFEEAPDDESPDIQRMREHARIDEAFERLLDSDPKGDFANFLDSLHGQWKRNRFLSPAQKEALFRSESRLKNG